MLASDRALLFADTALAAVAQSLTRSIGEAFNDWPLGNKAKRMLRPALIHQKLNIRK